MDNRVQHLTGSEFIGIVNGKAYSSHSTADLMRFYEDDSDIGMNLTDGFDWIRYLMRTDEAKEDFIAWRQDSRRLLWEHYRSELYATAETIICSQTSELPKD